MEKELSSESGNPHRRSEFNQIGQSASTAGKPGGDIAVENDELQTKPTVQYRHALIERAVKSGMSRLAAENLTDFVWTVQGWPLVCEEQWRNIKRWSLN